MALTKKQLEVFEYIKDYTKTHGLSPTQKEIKEHFGLKSFGSVQRYLKYLTELGLIENEWNQRRGIVLNTEDHRETSTAIKHKTNCSNGEEVPLLGIVAAGNPIEALENPSETIPFPSGFIPKKGKRYFALTVSGESMIEDGILDGDIVFLKEDNIATNGETVVAIVDGEATLKKFQKVKNKIHLLPANSTMKPIIVHSDQDFKIVGKLAGLVRVY